MDVDFRYINHEGNNFQSQTATSSSQFSLSNNTAVYNAAKRFGFTKNYQGTQGSISGITKVGGHNDHGHLGLVPSRQNIRTVSVAPIFTIPSFNPFK